MRCAGATWWTRGTALRCTQRCARLCVMMVMMVVVVVVVVLVLVVVVVVVGCWWVGMRARVFWGERQETRAADGFGSAALQSSCATSARLPGVLRDSGACALRRAARVTLGPAARRAPGCPTRSRARPPRRLPRRTPRQRPAAGLIPAPPLDAVPQGWGARVASELGGLFPGSRHRYAKQRVDWVWAAPLGGGVALNVNLGAGEGLVGSRVGRAGCTLLVVRWVGRFNCVVLGGCVVG
jgi:hypothetical protein